MAHFVDRQGVNFDIPARPTSYLRELGQKIPAGQHGVYARDREGGLDINPLNARVRVWAADKGDVKGAGKRDIVDESPLTSNQTFAFFPSEPGADFYPFSSLHETLSSHHVSACGVMRTTAQRSCFHFFLLHFYFFFLLTPYHLSFFTFHFFPT